ncbi:DUF11 domain-containing protein [Amycolatopsis australiensis]|uniref:Conserved repeat domain-containing protein n=1 Tax=Amycolatopsis australiensis TaxID=546364 RepID=A0A1K1PQ96_9PSEU|nr:DUF11 domain-containing protein [Amycolatopsis australiensis]SFW49621.1 conserved repeat domain-containing protein [Amycolatopsis australiensis]
MERTGRRTAVLAALATVALFAAPAVASAAPAPSTIDVSATSVHAGDTFTVTEQLYNPTDFTVTGAKAAVYAKEKPIVDLADLVSCAGTIGCDQYLSSFRGGVGDLGAGESRSVTFTFRVKEDVAPSQFTLQHQFAGDNYAFSVEDGPALTITPPAKADVKVALTATPRAGLVARVDYVITVSNSGPATATGVRVTANAGTARTVTAATGCTRSGATVNCAIGTLAPGATATAKFTSEGGVFAWGPFTATAQRAASAPADPVAANDTASKKCTAYTGLFVNC